MFTGIVVSNKSHKTVTVLVEFSIIHTRYKKNLIKSKKYLAHDEKNEFNINDIATIVESRPISKKKKWIVINKKNKKTL